MRHGRMDNVNEADSQDEAEPGAPEPAETSERRRPSRLLIVSAALALGAAVGGLAVLSRADTSVRVPELIGKPADPVGDNLAFAADTAGLSADVIDVTDCRVRDTNLVVKQSPAPGMRVSAGTSLTVYVCRHPEAEAAT
jgi:beta-lactam-binding protein with PASTA domain